MDKAKEGYKPGLKSIPPKTGQVETTKHGGKNFHKNGNGKNYHGKEERLDKKNKPFDVPEVRTLAQKERQNLDFETKADLIANLDDEDYKKRQTSQDIFYRLNGITLKKNQKNNQYLYDFNRWLLEKLKKGDRGKEDIWEDLKRIYKQFTIHGQKSKTGVMKNPDIDAASSLLLLEMAGFKDGGYENVNFVANSQSGPGVNIDTDDKEDGRIRIEQKKLGIEKIGDNIIPKTTLFNSKLIVNEHGGGPCSSTRMIYQILNSFGKIPQEKESQIKRFVEFVDIVDDLGYQVISAVSPYLERTIFGLHKVLPIEFILDYFKNPNKTGFEYLDDKYLQSHDVKVVDFTSGKYLRKSLKKLSEEKKQRMEKGYDEMKQLRGKGYFLMLGKRRFIVDLGGKLTDAPETVSVFPYGIIRVFPSGDLYVYSPDKLPETLGSFKVKNEHFIIDKLGSGNDINKLLNEFQYLPERKFDNSVDKGSKFNLKREIIEYRKDLNKPKAKIEANKIENQIISMENQFSILSEMNLDELEIGKNYKGIVNNIRGNMIFVTLDKNNKIRGTLHINDFDDPTIFESVVIGDILSVKLKEMIKDGENTKIKFSINAVLKQEKEGKQIA